MIYDSKSKGIFAHAVPQKGMDEGRFVVECFATTVLWLGWSRVIVRSDNEPAIVKLVNETLKSLKVSGLDQASAEGSIPYDPQSNGAAEAAVKMVKGSLQACHRSLEKQLGVEIPATHTIITWLVRHVAMMRTLRVRGSDGLTAYQKGQRTDH